MKKVQLREAKAKLSSLLNDAEAGTPTVITRHGKEVAMLVPIDKARKTYPDPADRPNFAEFLMTFPGGIDFESDRLSTLRDVDLD